MIFLLLFPIIAGPSLWSLGIFIYSRLEKIPRLSSSLNDPESLFLDTYSDIMDAVFGIEKTVGILEQYDQEKLSLSSGINLDYFYSLRLDSSPSKSLFVMYTFPYAIFHLRCLQNTEKLLVAIVRNHEYEDLNLPVKDTSFVNIFNIWSSFMKREGHILTYQEDFSENVEKDVELLEETLKNLQKINKDLDNQYKTLVRRKQQIASSLVEEKKTVLWLNTPLDESFLLEEESS